MSIKNEDAVAAVPGAARRSPHAGSSHRLGHFSPWGPWLLRWTHMPAAAAGQKCRETAPARAPDAV